MKETYLAFTFHLAPEVPADWLLAEFHDWPFEGFEELPGQLKAYLPAQQADAALRAALQQAPLDQWISGWEEVELAPQNWNAQWEEDYEPVQVGNFCRVRAHFHTPNPAIEHEILITPKMSFGTGHHATTYMMIAAMQKLDFAQKDVLDFGCGTAVLAILAEKLGAETVLAVDNDQWAYENSLENVALNACKQVEVALGGWEVVPESTQYQLLLANINRNVILTTMEYFAQRLSEQGQLLCSGILEQDQELVINTAEKYGFQLTERYEKEQWRCLLFQLS